MHLRSSHATLLVIQRGAVHGPLEGEVSTLRSSVKYFPNGALYQERPTYAQRENYNQFRGVHRIYRFDSHGYNTRILLKREEHQQHRSLHIIHTITRSLGQQTCQPCRPLHVETELLSCTEARRCYLSSHVRNAGALRRFCPYTSASRRRWQQRNCLIP